MAYAGPVFEIALGGAGLFIAWIYWNYFSAERYWRFLSVIMAAAALGAFGLAAVMQMSTPAAAQTTPPTSGPIIWQAPSLQTLTGINGVTISSTPMPKCDDGWSLVMTTAMQPMCARELKKPQ